jgi:purine-binding chemotaxis protein CheW
VALDTQKEDTIQLIGFYVGQKLFGTDILTVREILRNPTITTADDCPQFIEGNIEIRGESIPLVDLKQRMSGGRPIDGNRGEWVLIASAGGHTAAYAVDSVTRIVKIEADEILPAPDLILSGLQSQYIRGVCNLEFGLLIVLDLGRLLSAGEIEALGEMIQHP